MARACVYTNLPVHNGECAQCACTDEGTGTAYETDILGAPPGKETTMPEQPAECDNCGHYDLAHGPLRCNGRTSILAPIAYGMGLSLQTGVCDCVTFTPKPAP